MAPKPIRPSPKRDLGPPPLAGGHASGLLGFLEERDALHPGARKTLLGPDINYGRELLAALGRKTGGWIGWEAANLRGIAEELAFVALGESGQRAGGDIEIAALIGQALDEAIATKKVKGRFAELAGGLGFRHAVRDAILELRAAGVSTDALRKRAAKETPAHDLAPILSLYVSKLEEQQLVDPGGIFALALERFDAESPFVLDGVMVVAPTLLVRGLAGRLLVRLIEHGALVLPGEWLRGMEPPARSVLKVPGAQTHEPPAETKLSHLTLLHDPSSWSSAATLEPVRCDLFVAAAPADEIREVLRRTLAEGLRWDDVEIVATDVDAYGVALDAVAQHLGIGATALHGIPLARTRIGQSLERWLAWLDDGLPADTLRQALEAGDIEAGDDQVSTAELSRTLRLLQIGWGRSRYEEKAADLESGKSGERIVRGEDEEEPVFEARKAAQRATQAALAGLLRRLLAIVPAVPERGGDAVGTTCTALATATLRYLEMVRAGDASDNRTLERLRSRLDQLATVSGTQAPFSRALAELREGLDDLRAWTSTGGAGKPWSAAGGKVHLTDLAHAGTTCRPRTFIIGLDADRTIGARIQHPILSDSVRVTIDQLALPPTAERRAEQAWALAHALASLRGRMTLSYALAAGEDGRPAGPAPILLQVQRFLDRKPALTYKQFRERLGAPACGVPRRPADALDGREVWLGALGEGSTLLDGHEGVRRAYPSLDLGLRSGVERLGDAITPHHGIVAAAAGAFDPRLSTDRPISASSLELLAKCPLAWFYKYGLRLAPPDDPDYDPEAWLDVRERGLLLHELFERFTNEYRGRQADLRLDAATARMVVVADVLVAEWRARVPPPSEAVFQSERDDLMQAARAFLELERQSLEDGGGEWLEFELRFGWKQPVTYDLGDGSHIAIQGFIDRVDRIPGGKLLVIDYKTGSTYGYSPDPRLGSFRGGRRLQAALYASAAEALLKAEVARFEYRFPTLKGGNEVFAYSRPEILAASAVVAGLLSHTQSGQFVATTDAGDCKYCEYRHVCRVTEDKYGKVASPRATWAETNGEMLDAYRDMLHRRASA